MMTAPPTILRYCGALDALHQAADRVRAAQADAARACGVVDVLQARLPQLFEDSDEHARVALRAYIRHIDELEAARAAVSAAQAAHAAALDEERAAHAVLLRAFAC